MRSLRLLIKSYPFDQAVKLKASFSDSASCDPIDPDTVTLRVKSPTGTLIYTYPADIIKDSTGEYHFDVEADQAGKWFYRWEGTGVHQAVAEHTFTVQETAFGGSP